MVRNEEEDGAPSEARVRIWDSHYGPASESFAVFRDAVCSAFMPWTPELAGADFEGRVESISFGAASVGRVSTTPIIARKTKENISNSPVECVHANYIICGELKVEQSDTCSIATPGDLVLHHSHFPVTLTEKPGCNCDNLAFVIPISRFAAVDDAEKRFMNTLIRSSQVIEPLAACLNMLTRSLRSSSPEELSALFEACTSLLPLSLERSDAIVRRPAMEGGLFREILHFVDETIASPNLSPRRAADHAGVSPRYVHKLFAGSGTTFSSYVLAQRLERVRSELVSMSGPPARISEIAFRWGFSDLSTFNRAFKRRFGRAPKSYRS